MNQIIIQLLKTAQSKIRLEMNMQDKSSPENIKLRKVYKLIEQALEILTEKS